MRKSLILATLLALSGCGAAGVAGGSVIGVLASTVSVAGSAVQVGQEVCAVGQTIVALQNMDGTPVTVTGKAATDVANACKAVNGIVVSPPPAGTTVPTVVVAPVVSMPEPVIVPPVVVPAPAPSVAKPAASA